MSGQPLTTDRGTSAWRLTEGVATCSSARGLSGRVNLLQPQTGVQIDLADVTVNLLGVALETPLANETLADSYERVADLVATYLPTPARPHRVQIYWQHPIETLPGVRGLIDLQVLTQTDLLDSDPRRETISELPPGDVWRFSERGESQVDVTDARGQVRDADVPCVLVRPDGVDWSYVELVHPLDYHAAELRRTGDQLQIHQTLFVNFLEKGVILRSRVRGAIVDRRDDVETGRALYRELCQTAPPLAT